MTIHLKPDIAALSFPAVLAFAAPLPTALGLAGPVLRALLGATLQSAMESVPAGHAEAGPVLALAVHGAARVAGLILAQRPGPARLADAGFVFASGRKE